MCTDYVKSKLKHILYIFVVFGERFLFLDCNSL